MQAAMRILTIALVAYAPMTAHAQMRCGEYETFIDGLSKKYGEQVRFQAITENGSVLQILANVETGTWSAITVRPDGKTCMPASGKGYEFIDAPVGDPS